MWVCERYDVRTPTLFRGYCCILERRQDSSTLLAFFVVERHAPPKNARLRIVSPGKGDERQGRSVVLVEPCDGGKKIIQLRNFENSR